MAAQLSVSELLSSLARWGEKGQLKQVTAGNIRSAVERIASVLEPTELEDVSKINIEAALQRFHNLNPAVSSESLRVYKSRIQTALELFLEFKKDPVNWKPGIKTRTAKPPKTRIQATESAVEQPGDGAVAEEPNQQRQSNARAGGVATLTIPFPLRADVTINIVGIPRDLTRAECERIAAFLRPLASDFGREP